MKYDKDYVLKLAASLHIGLDDKLLETLVADINKMAVTDIVDYDATLVQNDFERRINCSKMKEDTPVETDVDALSGCKRADKFVVGK